MTSEEKARAWLAAAKRRAELIEQSTPMATRRRKARLSDLKPAAPSWYANDRVVIQDPPNFIEKTRWFKIAKSFGLLESEAA